MSHRLAVSTCFVLIAVAAIADTWTVYPTPQGGMTGPQQLTNAIIQCASGDTVLLQPGIYDLSGIYMSTSGNTMTGVQTNHLDWASPLTGDKTIHLVGESDVAWSKKTADAEVVLRGGGGRIIYLQDSYALNQKGKIRNITFENGRGSDVADYWNKNSRGGTMYFRSSGKNCWEVSNCVIRGSTSYCAGAASGGHFIGCCFTNNSAFAIGCCTSGYYEDCVFVNNVNTGNQSVAPINDVYSASNCDFIANSNMVANTDCGCLSMHDASSVVKDSRFIGNKSKRQYAALTGGVADHCVFERNAGSSIVLASICSNCTFIANSGMIGEQKNAPMNCFYGCTVTNHSGNIGGWHDNGKFYTSGTLFKCSVANSEFYAYDGKLADQWASMTNCLITGAIYNNDNGLFGYNAASPEMIVNCTFVNNTCKFIVGGDGVTMLNCLFWNNSYNNTTQDISCKFETATDRYFTNCLYRTCNGYSQKYVDETVNIRLGADEDVKFNYGKYPDYPAFMPLRKSKAVDAGLDVGFTNKDVDQAGNCRLVGSAVDIGCYEFCMPRSGLVLIFR